MPSPSVGLDDDQRPSFARSKRAMKSPMPETPAIVSVAVVHVYVASQQQTIPFR
jgi:hypothetical protein